MSKLEKTIKDIGRYTYKRNQNERFIDSYYRDLRKIDRDCKNGLYELKRGCRERVKNPLLYYPILIFGNILSMVVSLSSVRDKVEYTVDHIKDKFGDKDV